MEETAERSDLKLLKCFIVICLLLDGKDSVYCV